MKSQLYLLFSAAVSLTIGHGQESPPAAQPPEPATVPALTEDDLKKDVERLFEELGAESFKVREAATIKLWKLGDRAEPYVRDAARGGDIELRTRAAKLLSLFRYGIYPDTPPKIVDLINEFRHGDNQDKINAISQLHANGEMATAIKLVRSIENPDIRRQLIREIMEKSGETLTELLAAEKYDAVEAFLNLAAVSGDGMRDLSAFHLQRGTIDREIQKLRDIKKNTKLADIQYEQLAWHYRFKGDLDKALAAAESAKNDRLARSIRIAQGDLQEFIKSSFNPADRTIEAYGFTAASQRLSGDQEALEKTIETIKQYSSQNPDEEESCIKALLINSRVKDALAISSEGSTSRIELLIDQGQHAQALAELGIDNPKPPYTDWLDRLIAKFTATEDPGDRRRILGKATDVTELLIGWGEEEEARRILERFGESSDDHDLNLAANLIYAASRLGLQDLALRYTHAGLKRESKDADAPTATPQTDEEDLEAARVQNLSGLHDAEDGLVRALHFADIASAQFWWEKLRKKFPDADSTERLDHLEKLLGYAEKGEPDALQLLGKFSQKDAADQEEIPAMLTHLSDLYLRHEDRPKAMALLEKSLELEREDAAEAMGRYAYILASDDEWEKALQYFKAASEDPEANVISIVHYGIALEHNGKLAEAEKTFDRARLMALGQPIQHRQISFAFARFNEFDRAREASQIVINTAQLDESDAFLEARSLSDFLAYTDPARAALLKETYLIGCLKGNIHLSSVTTFSSIRGSAGSLTAQVALAAGKPDEALAIITPLVDQQPSNSSLIEDLYPLLVQAGKSAEADTLYQILNKYGEDALALFPNSPQDLNSNAWLKARCGKDLDIALQRSERSNEIREKNDAYLDTLAEIHFQRGDRDKAVETSEKAVELAGGEFLLYHQLQRFKTAKPLSELLAD